MNREPVHSFFDGLKDRGIIVGTVVLSKCGHDEGHIYVIAEEHDSYLFLCDGDKRSLGAPKKKRRKHVCPLGQIQNASAWLASLKELTVLQQNSKIRNEIRSFLDDHSKL